MLTLPRHWLVPIALAVSSLLVFLLPDAAAAELAWLRGLNGEQPWRLAGAHLVHLGAAHLVLNLAGLAVCWALVGAMWRPAVWATTLLPLALAIGAGLHLFRDIGGYVGLSGLIHGLFALGLVGMWSRWRLGAALGATYLVGKAVGEWWWPDAAIAEAHWVGTAAGALLGIMATLVVRRS